jgi:hypothetical protein
MAKIAFEWFAGAALEFFESAADRQRVGLAHNADRMHETVAVKAIDLRLGQDLGHRRFSAQHTLS